MSKIKKSDTVQVLSGKDRGKSGVVDKVLVKKNKVVVSGINIYKRHVKGRGDLQGGIIDIVKPLDISNVSLICPKCKMPTRVGFGSKDDQGKRMCKKCKELI